MEPNAAERQVAAVTAGKGHAGRREDRGVDQHDVGHGQKGGDSGQNLGAPVGSQMSEFKIAFEGFEHRRVQLEKHRVGAAQRNLCG